MTMTSKSPARKTTAEINYSKLWAQIAHCRKCRDDVRINQQIRTGWDAGTFVPFPSKGPEPSGRPVKYILVAEEPSSMWVGTRTRSEIQKAIREDERLRNFNGSLSDFLVRWAARQWLLRRGEAFYLTDLGKCSIAGLQAGPTRARRYNNCHEFLDREISVLRPRAIIPVGDDAYMWTLGFAQPDWPEISKPILHYAHRFPQNSNAPRDKTYVPDVDAINRYIQGNRPGSRKIFARRDRRAVELLRIYKAQFTALKEQFAQG